MHITLSNTRLFRGIGADELPLRKVKSLDLDHLTLVVRKTPVYSATSVEVRADTQVEIETRTIETPLQVEQITPKYDNTAYHKRVQAVTRKEGT